MRSLKPFVGTVLVVFLLLLAGAAYVRRQVSNHFVDDALTTAALAIHNELRGRDYSLGLDPASLEQIFVIHHKATVSPIWFDNAGRPVDAWGTPFRISHDQGKPVKWVLCESAGPDGEFDTRDDRSFRSVDRD